jgi:hypothetical protein
MIKADIAYNRILFIFLYTVILSAAAANSMLGGLEDMLATLMFFSVAFIGIVAGTEETKTNRIRFFAALPVPARHLGILRYPVFTAYWFSLMILLWLSSLVSQKGLLGLSYLWGILVKTGSVFILVACMGLVQDLAFCVRRKIVNYEIRGLAILFAIFGGPCIYFTTPFNQQADSFTRAVSEIFLTPSGAFGLFLFSLGLVVLNIYTYEWRKSYTE